MDQFSYNQKREFIFDAKTGGAKSKPFHQMELKE